MHPGTIDSSAGLMTQFLAWVGRQPRTYGDTMEAWRTSCPRISVWEDALLDGLVSMQNGPPGPQTAVGVILTQAGVDQLGAARDRTRIDGGGSPREGVPAQSLAA